MCFIFSCINKTILLLHCISLQVSSHIRYFGKSIFKNTSLLRLLSHLLAGTHKANLLNLRSRAMGQTGIASSAFYFPLLPFAKYRRYMIRQIYRAGSHKKQQFNFQGIIQCHLFISFMYMKKKKKERQKTAPTRHFQLSHALILFLILQFIFLLSASQKLSRKPLRNLILTYLSGEYSFPYIAA